MRMKDERKEYKIYCSNKKKHKIDWRVNIINTIDSWTTGFQPEYNTNQGM